MMLLSVSVRLVNFSVIVRWVWFWLVSLLVRGIELKVIVLFSFSSVIRF